MKRLIVIVLLVAAAFCCPLWAQTPDEVAGGTGDLEYSTSVPVTGRSDMQRKAATFNNRTYCRYFLEGTMSFTEEFGLGVTTAWVPGRVGPYASFMSTEHYYILNAGADLRLLRSPRRIDWHLYVGLSFSDNVGFDIGIRLSATRFHLNTDFSWLSFSLGSIYVNGSAYTTIGLSVELIALTGLLFWL